jgi:hypothetical protein
VGHLYSSLIDNTSAREEFHELVRRQVADLAVSENLLEISGVALSSPLGGLRKKLAALELVAALAASKTRVLLAALTPLPAIPDSLTSDSLTP